MFASALRTLSFALLAIASFALPADATSYDALLPLVMDLPGFEAGAADGMDLNQDDMITITVNRSYSRDDQSVEVTLMAGTHAMAQVQPAIQMETSEYRITVEQVEGFEVRRYFDKQENGGALFVVLSPGDAKGAVLILGYQGINEAEAMQTARHFDWKAMRRQVELLLK